MTPIDRARTEYVESRTLRKRYLALSICFFVLAYWVPVCLFISLTCFIVSNGYRRTAKQLKLGIDMLEQYREFEIHGKASPPPPSAHS